MATATATARLTQLLLPTRPPRTITLILIALLRLFLPPLPLLRLLRLLRVAVQCACTLSPLEPTALDCWLPTSSHPATRSNRDRRNHSSSHRHSSHNRSSQRRSRWCPLRADRRCLSLSLRRGSNRSCIVGSSRGIKNKRRARPLRNYNRSHSRRSNLSLSLSLSSSLSQSSSARRRRLPTLLLLPLLLRRRPVTLVPTRAASRRGCSVPRAAGQLDRCRRCWLGRLEARDTSSCELSSFFLSLPSFLLFIPVSLRPRSFDSLACCCLRAWPLLLAVPSFPLFLLSSSVSSLFNLCLTVCLDCDFPVLSLFIHTAFRHTSQFNSALSLSWRSIQRPAQVCRV